jgi:hypothetical protein
MKITVQQHKSMHAMEGGLKRAEPGGGAALELPE